jgi:sigma-E factor negative regulatory protein RseB
VNVRPGRPIVWAAAAASLLAACAALADDEARRWLIEMNQALAGRNYQGEFLHRSRGPVEKLRIFHRVRDGHVAERLVSLAPNGREIVRHDAEMQCYLPDQQTVLVETGSDRGSLLGAVPTFDADVERNYRVEFIGRAQVLGRPARFVRVMPRDGFRFGYRLGIDEQTKIPLVTELCDADGHELEEVLFTSLEVDGPLPDAVFRTSLDASRFAWERQSADPPHALAPGLPWRLTRLPPGFRLSASGEQHLPGSEQMVTHLVVSDGLASVSVFIEGPPGPPRRPAEGRGQVGSASVYRTFAGGHQITAVGEVPPQTLEYIASGVSAGPAPAPGLGLAASGPPKP